MPPDFPYQILNLAPLSALECEALRALRLATLPEAEVAIPKLNAVILNVADKAMLQTCVQWYLKLGLELSSSEPEESAFFNTGNGALFAIHL